MNTVYSTNDNSAQISWSDYFDSIVCMHYHPHTVRIPRLLAEFDRIGLLRSSVFKMFASHNTVTENTIKILNDFLDTGGSRLCIIENDGAFLKNISLLKDILDDIPDRGVAQMDKFVEWDLTRDGYEKYVNEKRVNRHFFDTSDKCFGSGLFLSLYRDAVEAWRNRLLQGFIYPDGQLRLINQKVFTSDPNAAVQIMYDDSVSGKKLTGPGTKRINYHTNGYRPMFSTYDDYNVPVGYGDSPFYDPSTDTNTKQWEMLYEISINDGAYTSFYK